MSIKVIKRNGERELLTLEKMSKMIKSACEGLSNVSPSQIEIKSNIQFYDDITTDEIQEILIKTSANLITEDTPNYQFVAARLRLFALRKHVWGSEIAPKLLDIIKNNIDLGVYDKELLNMYSEEEYEYMNSIIDHSRDMNFTYAGIQQVCDKYLVQDRTNGKIYETPQFAFMLIGSVLFSHYPSETRLDYVKKFYDAVSKFKISLSTPVISGVRTNTRQYASCVLLEAGDSLESIFSAVTAVGKYAAQKAGIGINIGRIRGINAKVRNGEVKHTGIIPFLKLFQSTMGSVSQGGLRKGSATVTVPIWHWEIEDVVVLKNNKGTEDNRVRHLDYSISISKLFYQRYMDDDFITMFSPEEVPELSESFGLPEFDELYLKAEKNKKIRRKRIKARELMNSLFSERAETGRMYILNIDHVNSHGSFKELISMSNLCVHGMTKIDILTEDGINRIINIQDLGYYLEKYKKVLVKSKNIDTGEVQFKHVQDFAMTSDKASLIKIFDTNTQKYLMCTPEHKIFTHNRGYVEAQNLMSEDILEII